MKARLNHLQKLVFATLMISFVCIPTSQASTSIERSHLNESFFDQIMTLHALDEESAINRLAKEALASELYHVIRSMNIEGYAGAWFDEESLGLKVAIANPSTKDLLFLQRSGAIPVLVQYGLKDLEEEANRLRAGFSQETEVSQIITSTFIDFPTNKLVVGIHPDYFDGFSLGEYRPGLEGSVFRFEKSEGALHLTSESPRIS
jgi:hypothetical protein